MNDQENNENEENGEETCRHFHNPMASLIFTEALEILETHLAVLSNCEEANDERQKMSEFLPSCFKRSYDMKFYEKLAERVDKMVDMMYEENTLEIECVADEIALHILSNILRGTENWGMLNERGRKIVNQEICVFLDRLNLSKQYTLLYDEIDSAKAIADPEFIRANNLKNLHIDKWFEKITEPA